MKVSRFSVLESIYLFEASLVLYAQFALGQSSANISSCAGCTITAGPSTLTYPSSVVEKTTSVAATVIPYIYQYADGQNVTSYSTYTAYTSGASAEGTFTSPNNAPLTWSTLGTVLTYPTTYIAFITPLAGISKTFNGDNPFCYASLTSLSLAPSERTHLIFPSSVPADHDIITAAAASYLETIPSLASVVAPFQPTDCSIFVGLPQTNAPVATSTFAASSTAAGGASLEPVTHTSVAFLLETGQAVINKVDGTKPTDTAEPANNASGGTTTTPTTGPSAGGSGGSTGGSGSGGNTGGTGSGVSTGVSIGTTTTPVLNIGGSTITAGPSGGFSIGGTTVMPGGSAVVISGTTISVVSGGSVAVINGATSTLGSAAYTGVLATATAGAERLYFSGSAIGVFAVLAALL